MIKVKKQPNRKSKDFFFFMVSVPTSASQPSCTNSAAGTTALMRTKKKAPGDTASSYRY